MEEIKVEYLPIWRRYLDMFEKGNLSDRDIGKLVWAMMEYQFEGKEPEPMNGTLRIYWLFIREDLDYARKQYETSVRNGRKGGRKKKPAKTQQNPEEAITITESISNQDQEQDQ